MPNTSGQRVALLIGAILSSTAGWAQPGNQSEANRAQESPPLLSGPTVEAEATAATLIRLGYDGRIERVEGAQPEAAALDLVDPGESARARIDELLEERAAFLDQAVTEHYRTLLELYTAFSAGDQAEVMRLYFDFTSHLQPLFARGGLGRQLAAEMAPDTGIEYARLLREYYAAVAQDILAHPEEARGNPPQNAAEAIRQYKVQLLMEEVGRSFARIIQQKTQEFEEVLEFLDLTPQRESEIRAMVESYAKDFGLDPTESQKRELFVRLMEAMTPAERQRLLAWVLR